MTDLGPTLTTLTLGELAAHHNLAFVPLLAAGAPEPDYLTLDEALAAGAARVTEVSAGGSVPELRLVNAGAEKVLLVDGEELVGAKQNRVLNVSILVAGGASVTIPVSCVEQGRWNYRSEQFSSAGRAQFAKGRAAKAAQVSESLRTRGDRRSDQGQVWDAIQAKAECLAAHAPTGAMADVYESRAADLEGYRRALRPREGQAGAVFLVGGEVAGLELFDSPATLARLWEKLVGSYALDAVEDLAAGRAASAKDGRAAAEAFVAEVATARVERFPAVALGEDLRLTGRRLAGGALAAEGRVVHLSAFRNDNGDGGRPAGRMARASARRGARR